MTVYGSNFYGLFKYGREALVDYDATPFIARPKNYGYIGLQWTPPSGTWTKLRLIRNPFGYPMTADDGDILLDVSSSYSKYTYEDTGAVPNNAGLIEGRTYYYSIFVLGEVDGQPKWFNAGIASSISVKNYGTADLMYEYLPFMYKLLNIRSASDGSGELNSDLYNFLRIFAFEHDLFKTQAEVVKNRYDILNLDGSLIPVMLNQFGLQYERELGIQQGRRMLQNASTIYLKKGSVAGVKDFINAFSGYNCYLAEPKNLMLNTDDSSFETGIGSWGNVANATIESISGSGESPAVTPYEIGTSPYNSQLGLLKVTPSSTSDVKFYCGDYTDPAAARVEGIPVTPGSTYSFTIYVRSKTSTKTIKTGIKWVKRSGAISSTTVTEVSSTSSTSAWVRTTAVTATAPGEAVWAIPYVVIASPTASQVHYFDAAQFEEGSSATTFIDARRIDAYLGANRINQIQNPSFETVTTNWTVAGGTGSLSTSVPADIGGAKSLKVAASGTTATITSDNYITVTPSDVHAFSAYVKGPATDSVKLKIEWFTSANSSISTSESSSVTLATSWSRASMTAVAPSNAAKAKVQLSYTTANTHEVYADAVLFEVSSYVQPYFDGSTGYAETTDLMWETTNTSANDAVNGRSLYYRNRVVTYKRLNAVLCDYVPERAPIALFIGYVN